MSKKNSSDTATKFVLAGLGILGLLFAVVFGAILLKSISARRAAVFAPVTPPASTSIFTPELTSTPLPTLAPTLTPRYTRIPEAPIVEYNLPPAPRGFTWRVIPELLMDVLVPDGWYYALSLQDDVDAFYVTKEPVDAGTGKYSTGMSVEITRKVKDVEGDAHEFLYNVTYGETTKKVVESVQLNSKSKTITVYSLMVESEFSDLDAGDPNRKKKMVCNAIADTRNNILYIMIFESPQEIWDEEWNARGGPVTLSVINLLFAGR